LLEPFSKESMSWGWEKLSLNMANCEFNQLKTGINANFHPNSSNQNKIKIKI